MTKRLNIVEFGSSMLDETIEKGQKLEERELKKSKAKRQMLRKALSHDPMRPYEMNADSPYYNPYKTDDFGGFMPHEASYWYEQGKKPDIDNYLTVKQFYGHKIEGVDQTMNRFANLRRSIEAFDFDIVKGEKAPIGTVHTYKDGQRYKKFAEGDWRPLAGLESGAMRDRLQHPKEKKHANDALEMHYAEESKRHKEIESHAQKHSTISSHIKKKQEHEQLKQDMKKEFHGQMKEVLSKLHGKLPPELEEHFNNNTSHLDPKLAQKVKRKEAGKGHEVHLSKQELTGLLKSGKYALISAGKNPANEEDSQLDDVAIGQRYEDLRGDLKQGGYAFTKVTGHYGGEEDSFLVMIHDHDENHILELGKKYNQDSVILADGGKQKMIFTTGKNEGKAHEGSGFKEVGEEQEDFYSEYKTSDGQLMKFALNFDFENMSDHSPSGNEQKATGKEAKPSGNEQKATGKEAKPSGNDAASKPKPKKKSGVSWEDVANAYKSLFQDIEADYLGTTEHDLIKGAEVPIGTVHTYKDGLNYKKVAQGVWMPVAMGGRGGRQQPSPMQRTGISPGKAQARMEKVEEAIENRLEREEKVNAKKEKKKNPKPDDVFNMKHPHEMISADKIVQDRQSPPDSVGRSRGKFEKTLEGNYDKRPPLDVWKVKRDDGSEYYSLRDGNTTFQMLQEFGLKHFPVRVLKEVSEKEAKENPVGEHERKNKHAPKAPKDAGKPDNHMGPPPAEHEAFVEPGKNLKPEDVERFIEAFKKDYVELQTLGYDLKEAGADLFSNRLKATNSLFDKMQGRLKDRSLNTVTDVIGARALAGSADKQDAILKHMKENYEIVELEDFARHGRPDGYRAIHLLFRSHSGKICELQIKTHRQQVYSGFTHDTTYKAPDHLKADMEKDETGRPKNKEVANYLNELSDYLSALDRGESDIKENRPKEPSILTDNGFKFPWEQIERIEKGDTSDLEGEVKESQAKYKKFERGERGKVKHFVVVRDKDKKVKEIREFDSFEKADKHLKSQKKDGERVAAYSDSKEEFMSVFSEYRQEGWEG